MQPRAITLHELEGCGIAPCLAREVSSKEHFVMHRLSLGFVLVLLAQSITTAAEPESIPARIQKHLESMAGAWKYEVTWGDKRYSGEQVTKLTREKTAMIVEGYELMDGKKTQYVLLSGWDGHAKQMVYRGFSSDGNTWAGSWNNLSDGKWTGNAAGHWNDIKWKSPTELKFEANTMRYQDTTDGMSWVAEYTRN